MARTLRALPALALCLAAAPALADPAWDEVVAAAKQEGVVDFYTSIVGGKMHLQIIQDFERQTGIKVQLLDVRASEMEMRFRAEAASSKYIADVTQNGTDGLAQDVKDGLMDKLPALPNEKNYAPQFAAQVTDYSAPTYMIPYGILVNTDLVRPEDEPRSWLDLADPKWKGRILSDDVRAPGGGFVWFSATLRAFGEDYERKMAAQGIVFSRDPTSDQQRVARGEYPLRIPQSFAGYSLIAGQGLPIKLISPTEGASYVEFVWGLMKHAPHPNAARLFMNFYLTAQEQLNYANNGLYPTVQGVDALMDPARRYLIQGKLLGTTNFTTRDQEFALAAKLFK